jgi:hypothetical protein
MFPATMLDGIATLDEHHDNMSAIFKAERLAAYFRFTQHGTPALHALPTVPAPPSGGVSAADIQTLIQYLRAQPVSSPLPTTTSAERERVKDSEGTMIKYQLLFGRTIEVVNPVDQADRKQTIQLAELTPVFLKVLQASKVTAAVQFF